MTTTIASALEIIEKQLPLNVRLVAVSKFHPDEAIRQAYDAGQRVFGESKVQEMKGKYDRLPKDIEWHFIGHLQTNKVKQLVPIVSLIHSVDSEKLLREIEKEGAKNNKTVDCLLQIHIAQEEAKFGFSPEECLTFFRLGGWKEMTHIRICGLMGMATFTEDVTQIESEFETMKRLYDEVKATYFKNEDSFCELSMGMSDDYPIALQYGATLVRVGGKIFGVRNY